MSKTIIAVAVLGALAFSGAVQAQTSDLPDPGMLPGSPFYFAKGFFEGLGTVFTFGNSAKAKRYLELAEKRLAEAKALANQGDENMQAAVARYEEQYAGAKKRAEQTESIDLEAQVAGAATKHLSVLDEVIERVPDQAKEAVRAAKERSMTGQIEALRGIARRDPEKAANIFSRAAEGRLNAMRSRLGDDDDESENEEEGEEIKEALAEYEKYAQFGQEISSLAEGLRTGETTVKQLVEKATSHHLDILREVQQKAPEQAQEGIKKSINKAEQEEKMEIKGGFPADVQKKLPLQAKPGTSDDEKENELEKKDEKPANTPAPINPPKPDGRP